jgi:alpha-aminoadipic semialdehyde synthase
MIFAITGKGRCSEGCYEVLRNLPHEVVSPDDLKELCLNKSDPVHRRKVYICYIESVHMVRNMNGKPFDKGDYYKHP